jgi:exonuclease SbcD
MKLLHTADIHLKKDDNDRLQIFEWMVDKAGENNIDYFIIAGDLFDSNTDAIELRSHVKKIFDRGQTKFLLVPGNHDIDAYGETCDYGENAVQFYKTPFEIMEDQNITICAVPYQDKRFSECIKGLPAGIDILIGHGTLYDESFIYSMLDDKETRYMPIFPGNLENIARYVALGHLHARAIEKKYKKTLAVYPGSPIAVDTKCTQKRSCYIIVLDENKLEIKPFDIKISPHWEKKGFFVFPGNEASVFQNIETFLKGLIGQRVLPHLMVQGYSAENDRLFNEKIERIEHIYADNFEKIKIDRDVKSWDTIVQNPLVQNFVRKTEDLDDDLRMKIFEIVFPIFSKNL